MQKLDISTWSNKRYKNPELLMYETQKLQCQKSSLQETKGEYR